MIAAEPKLHRWTRTEYQQMLELGWFLDRRAELVEGEILQLPAMKNAHAVCLKLTEDALNRAFGDGFWVRNQLPLSLSELSEPLPDLAVVPGKPRDYSEHPTNARLVVEVSDTALAYDRRQKASLYAKASLPEYWIVNLVDRQVEVHKSPIADETMPYGWRYDQRFIFDASNTVAVGAVSVNVADLMP